MTNTPIAHVTHATIHIGSRDFQLSLWEYIYYSYWKIRTFGFSKQPPYDPLLIQSIANIKKRIQKFNNTNNMTIEYDMYYQPRCWPFKGSYLLYVQLQVPLAEPAPLYTNFEVTGALQKQTCADIVSQQDIAKLIIDIGLDGNWYFIKTLFTVKYTKQRKSLLTT